MISANETAAVPADLAPDYVRRINPYVPGKPIEELAREYGLAEEAIVKLASNENPRGPSPKAREAIVVACAGITRYPDGNGFALKNALASRYGVDREQIVLGNGSNDILELATQARGATGIQVPARHYGHDLEAMARAVTSRTRIVFVANPNNPTGTWLPPAALRAFLAAVPSEVLIVLDEAYDEYLETAQRSPSVSWIASYRNLIVSRTFSKAYGLAGLRVGFGVMDASVADMLNRVRQPFNVSSIAQAAALAALADTAYVSESARLNRTGLVQLTAALDAMRVAYVPSHGNFLLVHVGDGAGVYERLLRQGVIVRPVANYELPEHLRVTVGLPEENRRFLAALESALGR